jgi:hypothetical protein
LEIEYHICLWALLQEVQQFDILFTPISTMASQYHAILYLETDFVATQSVQLFHEYDCAEDAEDADGYLQPCTETAENVVTGEGANSSNAALQRLAAEVPNGRNRNEQGNDAHRQKVNKGFAINEFRISRQHGHC